MFPCPAICGADGLDIANRFGHMPVHDRLDDVTDPSKGKRAGEEGRHRLFIRRIEGGR